MDLLARPCVEIVHCVGDNLTAETTPLRSSAVNPFAFKGALADAEIFGGVGGAKVTLGHESRSLVARGGGQSATGRC